MPLTTIGSFVIDLSHVTVSHVMHGSRYDVTTLTSVCSAVSFSRFGNLKTTNHQKQIQHSKSVNHA